MTPDEIQSIRDQLNRIETCLTGDSKMGHRGLVWSRDDHERRLSALERVGIYAGGGAAALALSFGVVKFLVEMFK